jgi:hypothetical protein
MIRNVLLGTDTEIFEESDDYKKIVEYEDKYPSAWSGGQSQKMEKYDKLYCAVIFFKINRVSRLLIEAQNGKQDFSVFDKDFYGHNIITLVTCPNFPTNIHYNNNKDSYHELFLTVLNSLYDDALDKLFDDILKSELMWGQRHMQYVFSQLSDRPYMLIALWNYGFKYTSEDIPKTCICRSLLTKTLEIEKIRRVPNGKRYHLFIDDCPITKMNIKDPAILPDGNMYEYEAIKRHLKISDINPMTGARLTTESRTIRKKIEGQWTGIQVSIKAIYLPISNKIEYFELINSV